jgi:hypothetical protein
VSMWTESICVGIGSSGEFIRARKRLLGLSKSNEFLDQLSGCLLTKDSGANLTRILLFYLISVTVLSRNIVGFANLKYVIVFLLFPFSV